jgi:hypothetical protein
MKVSLLMKVSFCLSVQSVKHFPLTTDEQRRVALGSRLYDGKRLMIAASSGSCTDTAASVGLSQMRRRSALSGHALNFRTLWLVRETRVLFTERSVTRV